MIEILADKCTGCGICDEECPQYVFKIDNGKAKVREQLQCYDCWHCVSACPSDAILLDGKSKKDMVAAKKANVAPDELQTLMATRRSTRCFKDEKVPEDVLHKLMDVVKNAGSAMNGQTEEFVVVTNRDLMRKMDAIMADIMWNMGLKFIGSTDGFMAKLLLKKYGPEMIRAYVAYHHIFKHRQAEKNMNGAAFYNAPMLLVAHGIKSNVNAHASSSIALRNVELLAHSMGLGTCWSGMLNVCADHAPKTINPLLGIGMDRQIYGALMIGYPKHLYKHLMPKKERVVKRID